METRDLNKALELYDRASRRNMDLYDSISMYLGKSNISMIENDYRQSKFYMDSVLLLSDKIARMITSESASRSQRDFYSSQTLDLKEKEKLSKRNHVLTICFIVLVFIAALSLLYFRLKVKKIENKDLLNRVGFLDEERMELRHENTAYMEEKEKLHQKLTEVKHELDNLNRVVEEKDKTLAENDKTIEEQDKKIEQRDKTLIEKEIILKEKEKEIESSLEIIKKQEEEAKSHEYVKSQLRELYHTKLTPLTKIWSDLVESEDSGAHRASMIAALKGELKKFRSPKEQKKMIADIDLYMDGAATELQSVPELVKEEDLYFIYLMMAGVHPKLICFLCDLRPKTFYTKRARLKTKLEQSNLKCKDIVLNFIS